MPHRKRAFFVSDRTGITVEALGSSLLSQFAEMDFLRVTLLRGPRMWLPPHARRIAADRR